MSLDTGIPERVDGQETLVEQVGRRVDIAMPSLASLIDKEVERLTGKRLSFTLMVFIPDGNAPRIRYVSSCPRSYSISGIEKMLSVMKREKGGSIEPIDIYTRS